MTQHPQSMRRNAPFKLYFTILITWILLSGFQLRERDVRLSMEEMLSYHVESKSFDPLLARRALKIFIEQFDAEKIYLLAAEARPYITPTDETLQQLVRHFKGDDLSAWKELYQLFQKAIARAQRTRRELQKEILTQKERVPSFSSENYANYASNESELRQRIQNHFFRMLAMEKQQEKRTSSMDKLFSFLEGRYARFEAPYLGLDLKKNIQSPFLQEHFLSMHILKALAKSLDAHTAYFSPEEAVEMRTMLEKQFDGIGVVLRESVDGVVIQDMIKGAPAEKSGKVVSGDLIVEVNGQSVKESSYEEILKKMQGKGSIELGLSRNEGGIFSFHKVNLLREKITMQEERVHYQTEPFAQGIIGKIQLPSFYENGTGMSCEKDMREALKELKKQGDLLGLVIDLRENSGGFLNQAVKVSGLFISSGIVVISKYAQGETQYLRDLDAHSYYNGPLILLTSKASASAAEIVAQALQDYGTALIIGDERTYGKGTIQYQTITDKMAASFFKVTVGRYYTVSGRSTQIDGVIADIHVPTLYSPFNIGERYLEYPLKSDRVPSAYIDPLTDVDQSNQRWFQKNYLPNLQKKLSLWTQMLPQLKENSVYRLNKNKNYKQFLEKISQGKKEGRFSPFQRSYSDHEDFPMMEAVNIIKDMILLHAPAA